MLDQHRKEIHEQFSQILTTIGKNKNLKPKVPAFAITTRSGASTRDSRFPNSPQPTTTDHTKGTIKRKGSEREEPNIFQNEEIPRPPTLYHPSKSKLSLRVRNETVTFNIGKSMKSKYSRDDYLYCADHTAKLIRDGVEPVKTLEWKALENRLNPSSVEPPKLEQKELPEHLEYAFLQEDNQLPVVISFALSATEKARLLEVLRNHKGAIAWSIANIKGVDSSFCYHKILMENEF
uniref:Reverse transcriptase domain-containing protein n=1 Tax=Tanacetum cinerariifolium TaxID=118510 RepID=A0A699GSP7_TANCI|nr:hypothetical protein [Tanacetum cinerariifolium]